MSLVKTNLLCPCVLVSLVRADFLGDDLFCGPGAGMAMGVPDYGRPPGRQVVCGILERGQTL